MLPESNVVVVELTRARPRFHPVLLFVATVALVVANTGVPGVKFVKGKVELAKDKVIDVFTVTETVCELFWLAARTLEPNPNDRTLATVPRMAIVSIKSTFCFMMKIKNYGCVEKPHRNSVPVLPVCQ